MGKSKSQAKREEAQENAGEKTQAAPATTVLQYEQSQRVDLNGKVYEGTTLTFATPELAAEAQRVLFEAHGVSPVK